MALAMVCRVLGATVLACLPAALAAQQAAPATRGAPDIVVRGETPARDRVVCRNEQVTGSIMPRRVCRSERQAEEARARGLEALRTAQAQIEIEREIRLVRDGT